MAIKKKAKKISKIKKKKATKKEKKPTKRKGYRFCHACKINYSDVLLLCPKCGRKGR